MARAASLQRTSGRGPKPIPRARSRRGLGGGPPAQPFGPVVQTKMEVGPARDRFEAEADRTAARVVDGIGPVGGLSRVPGRAAAARKTKPAPDKDEDKPTQRKAKPGPEKNDDQPAQRKAKPTPKRDDDQPAQRKTKPTPKKDEDKPAQPKTRPTPKKDDDQPAQRKAKPTPKKNDDRPAQRKARTKPAPTTDDDKPVQRDAAGPGPAAAPSSVEQGVHAARGGGRPMSPPTLGAMESAFGRDFGGVRIHDDAAADRMAGSIDAVAFTTGNDIFFSRGAYDERTSSGQRLLAHELTHVAQQAGPGQVQTKRIQRQGDGNGPPADGTQDEEQAKPREWAKTKRSKSRILLDGPHGGILYKLPELVVPSISNRIKGVTPVGTVTGGLAGTPNTFVPKKKFLWTGKGHRSVIDEQTGDEDTSSQVQIWERWVKQNSAIKDKIEKRFEKSKNVFTRGTDGPRVYYLQHTEKDARSFTLIGTAEELARHSTVLRPPFSKGGEKTQFMQVDHYIEIQLGGMHVIENMWLLDADANQKSGRDIKQGVVDDVNELVGDAAKDGFWGDTNPPEPARLKSWPENAHIEFAKVEGKWLRGAAWDKDDIAKGKQINRLEELTPRQMKAAGLGLKPGDQPKALSIFLSKDSAFRRVMKVDGEELKYRGRGKKKDFIKGFHLESAAYHKLDAAKMENDAQIGTLEGTAFGNRTVKGPDGEETVFVKAAKLSVPVRLRTQHGFESYIDRAYIDAELRKEAARVVGASPIAFTQIGLSDNWELLARGTVTADNPLFPGLQFGISLIGDAVVLDVKIPLDALQLGPFKATEADLSLGVNKKGVFYAGTVGFIIEGVGSGMLTADKQKLAGEFDFDLEAFDPAKVDIAYENGAWSGGAELGLEKGVVPFVDDANVEVRVDENGFFMDGTATLSGPGIPASTTLTVKYVEETGELEFGADISFDTAAIKGLSNARASVSLTRKGDGTWSIAGSGGASISLPAISGSAKASYEDGYLDVDGEAKVNRPPMTGKAEFHLSNRPVNEAGEAVEGPPLATFRIWGTGSASIQFGDYITGTVGIAFLENGEVELVGVIELPPEITLVRPTEYDYPILDFPQVRFPVIGLTIPVIRKSFGVFAYVGGGIDAVMTVGPGVLVDTQVTVQYNPDHPEEASISGGSTFQMSAGAEVGLSVVGGIGAGLGIVEATGEVGLRGSLGFDLIGGGSVLIEWTPAKGLEVDASVFGEATPKFKLAVIAEAKVVVDAWLWSGTVWSADWEKTLAEIGPDMTWRAELPAWWSEQDGLDVDIDKLEITKPDIDIAQFGEEVFEAVT